jgi:hypothetical protein
MKLKLYVVFFLFVVTAAISFSQNTVYLSVTGGNEGRGILKSRGNECFIIAPHHVVKDALEDINITGEKRVKSTGSIEKSYSANDLSILRVEKGGNQKCTDWYVASDFEKIVESNSNGFVEYRESDGSTQKVEIEIIGVNGEEIQIQRKDPMTAFVKGWSGSSLFVNQNGQRIYLGMLYQLQGRAGYVMRADHMFNVMTSFFGKEEKETTVENPETDVISGNFNKTSGVMREMETKQVKLSITRFEQNNNKAIFHYTLTNRNAAQQIVEFNTHIDYFNLIDQNGLSYKASQIQIGNDDNHAELIYNVPVNCMVEFEVGMNKITKAAKLEVKGYQHEFKFFNIELSGGNKVEQKNTTSLNSSKSLGTQSSKLVSLIVNKFEQNNNKAIFHYSLTNKNPAQQIVDFNTHIGYFNLIDQNGYSYQATQIQIGNDDNHAELIYNVPVNCMVEFEVGMNKITKAAKLQIKGYYHDFIFTHLNLTSAESITPAAKQNNTLPSNSNTTNTSIGSMDLENVRLKVNNIEHVGSKLIVQYSYENLDAIKQIKNISTHQDYNKIKLNGAEFSSTYVSLGSTGHNAELVYQVPVPCYAEFDIGAIQPDQIESLKLALYNHDFEFAGTGAIGTPKSLKSMKLIQERNELINNGIKLGWDLLTKKKN